MSHFAAALLAALGAVVPLAIRADPAEGTHRLYEVRGAKLYTETFGHGAPMVFLHGGLLFFDNAFAQQVKYFASYRTVIGIDQRGHGHSADGPWSLSYQGMAEDTAALIEQLGVGAVDVVGHSDGADIALLLARDHPQLVRRLIISGANLRGLPPEEVRLRSRWSPAQSTEHLHKLADSLPSWFESDYARVSPDGRSHWMTLIAKCNQMWIQSVVLEPADLKKISAPVLVMAGDRDFTSIEETGEIFRGLPRGQLMLVPGTGHATFIKRPGLVNLAIREFLDQPESDIPAH